MSVYACPSIVRGNRDGFATFSMLHTSVINVRCFEFTNSGMKFSACFCTCCTSFMLGDRFRSSQTFLSMYIYTCNIKIALPSESFTMHNIQPGTTTYISYCRTRNAANLCIVCEFRVLTYLLSAFISSFSSATQKRCHRVDAALDRIHVSFDVDCLDPMKTDAPPSVSHQTAAVAYIQIISTKVNSHLSCASLN
jgi:hypothetical protein